MVGRLQALRVRIIGVVQGVGFRPFIYRIAVINSLKGYVVNLGGSEVEVWIEGEQKSIKNFLNMLHNEKPPPARIDSINIEELKPKGFKVFKILKSEHKPKVYSQIPPDFKVCKECLREVLDPYNRRFRYPFNSCAWCGPRFSMMYTVPYDRENTAMNDFPLCEDCLKEYEDPWNTRRFHAQGISCPKCGPSLKLVDRNGEPVEGDPITAIVKLVEEGFIVAIKGLGGFHIAALATDDEVVMELRRRKKRPQKPFALMALDLNIVEKIACPSELHKKLLESPESPIVLIPKRENSPVSELVAPGLDSLGIMLTYTPLHYLILRETKDKFLIMTSGNPPGLPVVKDNGEALKKLKNIADYFLLHNRVIVNRVDDSVVRLTDNMVTMIRRSRGYAPLWFKLPFKLKKKVRALGAMLTNTGAIAFGEYVIPTQYVGDCDKIENIDFLVESLNFLEKAYNFKPDIIAVDLHPRYSTRILGERQAREEGVEVKYIQHHHAHIISAMASNSLPLDSKVIGIAIDGVGYGLDGQVWGGEILLTSYTSCQRLGHLEYLPLPGGDIAVKYPARILIGLLYEKLGEDGLTLGLKLKLHNKLPRGLKELEIVAKTVKNSIRASSVGRFLDTVSTLLGVCWERTYEGEPAIKLEAAAKGGSLVKGLKIEYEWRGKQLEILTIDFIMKLIELLNKEPVRDLAYTTQILLGRVLAEAGMEFERLNKVVVSGGSAVNNYIIKGIKQVTGKILLPKGIPAGDGGISLGQSVVAGLID